MARELRYVIRYVIPDPTFQRINFFFKLKLPEANDGIWDKMITRM